MLTSLYSSHTDKAAWWCVCRNSVRLIGLDQIGSDWQCYPKIYLSFSSSLSFSKCSFFLSFSCLPYCTHNSTHPWVLITYKWPRPHLLRNEKSSSSAFDWCSFHSVMPAWNTQVMKTQTLLHTPNDFLCSLTACKWFFLPSSHDSLYCWYCVGGRHWFAAAGIILSLWVQKGKKRHSEG